MHQNPGSDRPGFDLFPADRAARPRPSRGATSPMFRSPSARVLCLLLSTALFGACGDASRSPAPSGSAAPAGSAPSAATPSASAPATPTASVVDPGPSARSVTVDGRDVAIDCRG